MQDRLKNVSVDPMFVLKHNAAKLVLGYAAGYLVGKVYDETILKSALEKLYEARKK